MAEAKETAQQMILIISVCALLTLLLFVLAHLRDLTDEEVSGLATYRRQSAVRSYFTFHRHEVAPNPAFKRAMDAKGRFYQVNVPLSWFPSTAAALLKYKKHEWMIIGFERDKSIHLIWINKGSDNHSVISDLPTNEIITEASRGRYRSVFILHNHPNSNPHLYDCTSPSQIDYASAASIANELNVAGLSTLEFVCERGRHYQYWLSPADQFVPLSTCQETVCRQNGASRWHNLCLHVELLKRRLSRR